ncbi:50S ribosomal protein L4 [Deinococcus yavapaiensis]|uniref:Large ribosomal subunit protein uL4 n=1 Tax=Deinococcus yavapaiensis KR-236 TaxID=694435 RepID=A0A318S2Y4_9DEIO|nr:50S ribosomal protein L4 [Deinococcus yavapaiensis]PYE48115.1 LSU ribosomal protein L4P [Deinococcus yavapaiensis KR-236]
MAQINVVGTAGSRTIDLDLPEVNVGVLHDVVTWQLAKRRAGTASTKTRSQVSRTGKKMYSQKGTGNARHGNRAAPIFVGGGVAFGPKPRDYEYTLPKKVRQLGLAMALADRAATGKLLAVDSFGIDDGKTKSFLAWAAQNGLDGSERVFVVTDNEIVRRAARNLPWVLALPVAGLNVYDILRHDRLVIDALVLTPASAPEGSEQ